MDNPVSRPQTDVQALLREIETVLADTWTGPSSIRAVLWRCREALAAPADSTARPSYTKTEQDLWLALGQWSIEICRPDAELAPPRYLIDAVRALCAPAPPLSAQPAEPKQRAGTMTCHKVPAGFAINTGIVGEDGDILGFYIVGPDANDMYHIEGDGISIVAAPPAAEPKQEADDMQTVGPFNTIDELLDNLDAAEPKQRNDDFSTRKEVANASLGQNSNGPNAVTGAAHPSHAEDEQVERLNVEQACATLRKHFSGHVWIASLLESLYAEVQQLKEINDSIEVGYYKHTKTLAAERDRAVRRLDAVCKQLADAGTNPLHCLDSGLACGNAEDCLKQRQCIKRFGTALAASLQPQDTEHSPPVTGGKT